MNINKIIEELRDERERIEQAIVVMQKLAAGRGARRGRPPAWMREAKSVKRGRPKGSKNKPKG